MATIEMGKRLGLLTAACVLAGAATALHAASTATQRSTPVAATGAGRVRPAQDDSARRASEGKFDANGKIRCTEYAGEPLRECEFGVARAGDGHATVVVTKPDGDPRVIFFRLGQAVGVKASRAGGDPDFSAEKHDGVSVIRIGEERYEIPDSVVM